MTAVLSPAVNSILFGMPAAAVVPSIMIKSVFLAIAASWVAEKSNKVSLWSVLVVILSYQLFGSLVEWIMTGSLYAAAVDFRLGVPGMLIQWLGGFLFIKYMK